MPYVQVPVRRAEEIVPPEAARIASQLHRLRERGEALAVDLRAIETRLDNNWNGRAKDQFLGHFQTQARTSAGDAALLGERADYIARIHVTVWKTVLETVYRAD
jgi:hypothetical protein